MEQKQNAKKKCNKAPGMDWPLSLKMSVIWKKNIFETSCWRQARRPNKQEARDVTASIDGERMCIQYEMMKREKIQIICEKRSFIFDFSKY